jgi:hypothetical protein
MSTWKRNHDFATVEGRARWELCFAYRNLLGCRTLYWDAERAGDWGLADIYRVDVRAEEGRVRTLVHVLCGRQRPVIRWKPALRAGEATSVV